MKIYQFFAPDIRQAMRMARDALGDNATILTHKAVPGGIELSASLIVPSENETLSAENIESSRLPPEEELTINNDYELKEQPVTLQESNKEELFDQALVNGMKEELFFLRNTLQQQFHSLMMQNKEAADPMYVFIKNRLSFLGFGNSICEKLLNHINTQQRSFTEAWQEALSYLEKVLPTLNVNIISLGGTIALLGPTGVGKTSTIAKLATSYVLKHEPESLGLITTDDYRVTGHEQLSRYGSLLGVDVFEVYNNASLNAALKKFKDKHLVLIDTSGISQRDTTRIKEQFDLFGNSHHSIQFYLALSGTSQLSVLKEIVSMYSKINLKGVILTKIDESINLGTALSIPIEYQLPVAYITDGQQVPQNIKSPDAKQLLQLMLKIAEKYNFYSEERREQEDSHA